MCIGNIGIEVPELSFFILDFLEKIEELVVDG
jgi:hypothetical protein